MAPTTHPLQLSLETGRDGKGIELQAPTSVSLTPPVTPVAKDGAKSNGAIPTPPLDAPPEQTASLVKQNIFAPLHFSDDLEICHDDKDRAIEFGRGAWSIVYKALSTPRTTGPVHTPPSSPIASSRVYAVKAPLRRDARPVLKAEALILTRLNLIPGHERHIVPFHGLHSDSDALVMSAVPLALCTFIEDKADLARKQPSTATMFDPVQGVDSWRDLARKLISGLAWLHQTAGLVHGDIKPHNLLLRPVATEEVSADESHAFPYEPLLADFSSSVDFPSDASLDVDSSRSSMSAFTPPFTAPELLASLTSGDVTPTPASDIFSLAATLLAAATGDLLLYPGSSNMQRLAMAREGHRILEFTRSGNNGCRAPRNGFVEKLILPAVAKDPLQRIDVGEWVALASS